MFTARRPAAYRFTNPGLRAFVLASAFATAGCSGTGPEGEGSDGNGEDGGAGSWAGFWADASVREPGPFSIPGLGADAGGDASVRIDANRLADACPDNADARPNAGLREVVFDARCPPGMVVSGAVCVDRYEAFVDRVNDGGATVESLSPYRPIGSGGSGGSGPVGAPVAARSVAGAVPHGYVSGVDADRACRGAGKRLCTSAEWLRACRGAANNVFPYGNARRPGVCNDSYAAGHPAASCFGSTASWIYSELGYPGINQQANTVDRTGENTSCVTSEGLFDMMGNVHEWVRDVPGTPPTANVDFRGGFYADTSRNGDGCLYATSAHSFSHWDYSTGFRCCAELR